MPAEMRRFVAEHGDVVLKPLDGMGGRGIFRVKAGDKNLNSMLETLLGGDAHGAGSAIRPWRRNSSRKSAPATNAFC